MIKYFKKNINEDWEDYFLDSFTRLILIIVSIVFTFVITTELLILGGTALFRSHNTNPKIGTVWTGGITSGASEKCYGPNLIVTDGNGLSTIDNAQVCK